MSSWLHLVPIDVLENEDVRDWAADLDLVHGRSELPGSTHELPTVDLVLSALRDSDCHGTAWFAVEHHDVTLDLPGCPDPASCTAAGGRDLGEVTVRSEAATSDGPLGPTDPVTSVSFRKPHPDAVLAVAVVLAERAGPMVVLDDAGTAAVVVSPGDDLAALSSLRLW